MTEASFYAHSTGDPTKSDWQPLDRHLSRVSELAAGFAARFEAGEWGRACGLLHDLGKFSPEFQRRLEGGPKVDHATAGARKVLELFGPALGRLAAYAIAGHHSGLPDGGVKDGPREDTLSGRLERRKVPAIDGFEEALSHVADRLPAPPIGRSGFSASFFVRMVFSCLVDADFLDTEAWLEPARSARRPKHPSVSLLSEHLDRDLDARCSGDTMINRRRAEILSDCRRGALLPPGIFSLTVPTGGGKTLSSLSFALRHAKKYGLNRVVYAIPYTSIIEQNAAVFRGVFSDLADDVVLEHHSNYQLPREDEEDETSPALRLRLAAENWDAPIVVTTNVQLFESLFAARGSRCRKLHNLARSVLILDEAQMLPAPLLQPCIQALRELSTRYGATVVLCTATQPALQASSCLPCGFGENEIREIVANPRSLYDAFRRVDVSHCGRLSDEEVVAKLRSCPRGLCIVNTRSHARRLFEALGSGEGHFHLSALLCPEHRTRVLAEIRRRLAQGQECRVVATQLVEAGVDLDFPFVLRALAGLDSVAQAAGRCNREGRLVGRGEVLVFEPECGVPPGWFQRTAAVGALTARSFSDLLSPDAIRHYFAQLYSFEGADGLDRKGVLRRLEENASTLSFPFREVAEEFRLIENEMESLIIPYGEEAYELIGELRHAKFPAATARRLQRYTVQVYRRTLAALAAAGVVESVGDRFHVLTNGSLYRDDLGLCPEDPTFREQEDNVF